MKLSILIAALLIGLGSGNVFANEKTQGERLPQAVKHGAKAVGHGTRRGTKAIGHGTRKVAKAVGHGTRDAARATGHAFRDAARELKK